MPRRPFIKDSELRICLLMDLLVPNPEYRWMRFRAAQLLCPTYSDRCEKAFRDKAPSNKQIAFYLGVSPSELDFYLNPRYEDYIPKGMKKDNDGVVCKRYSDKIRFIKGRDRDLPKEKQILLCSLMMGDKECIEWFNDGICFGHQGERIVPEWAIGEAELAVMRQAAKLSASAEVLGIHRGSIPYTELSTVIRFRWLEDVSILKRLSRVGDFSCLSRTHSDDQYCLDAADMLGVQPEESLSVIKTMRERDIGLILLWTAFSMSARKGVEMMAEILKIDLQGNMP